MVITYEYAGRVTDFAFIRIRGGALLTGEVGASFAHCDDDLKILRRRTMEKRPRF